MNQKQDELPNLVLYGNLDGRELIVLDADAMAVHSVIELNDTQNPYAVDRIGDKLLSIARGFKAVERIDIVNNGGKYNFANRCTHQLKHSPRTARGNAAGDRALVSGADVAVSSVLGFTQDCLCVEVEAGNPSSRRGEGAAGIDFGGGNASGHEFWLDDRRFAILDRVRRVVAFFDSESANPALPIEEIELTTTPHHLIRDPDREERIYVACEGSPKRSIPPSIFVIDESDFGFEAAGQIFLPVPSADLPNSGGHHLDLFQNYIYMGSSEGNLYIVDRTTLNVVNTIRTGKGHGHTGFLVPSEGCAFGVSINHRDTYVSVIDAISGNLLGNVDVAKSAPSREPSGRLKLAQGHTSFRLIRDGVPYFYVMVSHESRFVEVNIQTLSIERELDIAGDDAIKAAHIEDLYMV